MSVAGPALPPITIPAACTPAYCTRRTMAEAAEESRKATAEAMRELQAALKNHQNPNILSPADSEVSSTESEYEPRKRLKRSRSPSSNSNSLEQRIHYLRLDLLNKTVEADELKSQIVTLDYFKDLNNGLILLDRHIAQIDKALASKRDSDNLFFDYKDLKEKSQDITSSFEQLSLATPSSKDYGFVQAILQASIDKQRLEMYKKLGQLHTHAKNTRTKEFLKRLTLWCWMLVAVVEMIILVRKIYG